METSFVSHAHQSAAQSGGVIPYFAGHERCEPGHSWGPGVRDCYLIHYVAGGRGAFTAEGRDYALSKGRLFCIFPQSVSYYRADPDDPWEYSWIGFGGSEAARYLCCAGITEQSPVADCRDGGRLTECLDSMQKCGGDSLEHRLRMTGLMYEFLSLLVEGAGYRPPQSTSHRHFTRADEYIRQNYSRAITVEGLASFVGISRKHLFHIFKKACGIAPEQYILRMRMDKACEFLGDERLPIGTVAHSVGYGDALLFSKMFKRICGLSPTEYRRQKSAAVSGRRPPGACRDEI